MTRVEPDAGPVGINHRVAGRDTPTGIGPRSTPRHSRAYRRSPKDWPHIARHSPSG